MFDKNMHEQKAMLCFRQIIAAIFIWHYHPITIQYTHLNRNVIKKMENKDDTEQLQAIYNGILDIPTVSNNILKK